MAYFLLRLNAPRPTFPADATDSETAAMNEHFGYWQAQAESGAAVAVGPVFDPAGPWGMAVVEVDDESAAKATADNDPVIAARLGFRYDIFSIPSMILRQ